MSESTLSASDPYSVITTWFYDAAKWDLYLLTQSSGMVQYLLGVLPKPLHAPFLVGYGIAQPVLPANLFEPTIVISRIIGSLRAIGWYALLPLLLYGLIAAWKSPDPRERRVWLWFGFIIWVWIVLVSIRAGADQWDNPRYRVYHAALAGVVCSLCLVVLAGSPGPMAATHCSGRDIPSWLFFPSGMRDGIITLCPSLIFWPMQYFCWCLV